MLCFFLLFCLALAQCSSASNSKAPAPPKTPAAAPVYSWWHPDPKLVNCLGAYHAASATCYHKMCVSYWTRKVAIQHDCCKAIVEMEDDCANYVFSKFIKLLLPSFVTAPLRRHRQNQQDLHH